MNACLSLAVMNEGAEVTTIEDLGQADDFHPMQSASINHDGHQCDYCAPGQIYSAIAVLDEIRAGVPGHVTGSLSERPKATNEEIREGMAKFDSGALLNHQIGLGLSATSHPLVRRFPIGVLL